MKAPQRLLWFSLAAMLLPLPHALGEDDYSSNTINMGRYGDLTTGEARRAELELSLAVAKRKTAEAKLFRAQSERLAQISAKVSEQYESVCILTRNAEYASDFFYAIAANPYAMLHREARTLVTRSKALSDQGRFSREGQSAAELEAMWSGVLAELEPLVEEISQTSAAAKQNQENYYREQVLENQQQMISQQREMIKQQQKSADDIAREIKDAEWRLRNLR